MKFELTTKKHCVEARSAATDGHEGPASSPSLLLPPRPFSGELFLKQLLLPLLFLSSSAGAAAVDCSTMQLVSLNFLTYKEKAAFPNPAKEVTLDLNTLKAPFKACGATFTSKNKGEVITVQTAGRPDMEYLTSHFYQDGGINLPLYLLLKESGFADGLEITINMLDLIANYDISVFIKPPMARNAVVGVKIDGGKLQPLYWNQQVYQVKFGKKTKTLDFYVKTNLPVSWQRVTVDLTTPKTTIYRKWTFPTK